MTTKSFDSIQGLIKEYNKNLRLKSLGHPEYAGVIGHKIMMDNKPMRVVLSNRYTNLFDKDGQFVARYYKAVGLKPFKVK